MNWKLIESTPMPAIFKGKVSIKLEIELEITGRVFCIFYMDEVSGYRNHRIKLHKVLVSQTITKNEYQALTKELSRCNSLFEAAFTIGLETIQDANNVLKEYSLGPVEYVIVLSAKTKHLRRVKRSGKSLNEVDETVADEHRIDALVKFKEVPTVYELRMEYKEAEYKVKMVPGSNRNKNDIKIDKLLNEEITEEIVHSIKRKVDFVLP